MEETRPLRPSPRALLLDDTIPSKEQSCYETIYQRVKDVFVLWSTQSLSQLGSAMTSFALALWLYGETGSALQTALLSVCSYAPYVVMSVFAGALSDRWDKKKVMLACDSLAALSTIAVLVLLKGGWLAPGTCTC